MHHVFICFVLEHLSRPLEALKELKRVLKTGDSLTVIEGDHGSTYFHPDSFAARKVVEAQVVLQGKKGGNANIGRELYPLLSKAGLSEITVSPRQVYVDDSKPELLQGFIRNTFTAMIKGISEEALEQGIINEKELKSGIRVLIKLRREEALFAIPFSGLSQFFDIRAT